MSVALVTVVVPDYDDGIAFYVDTLGFDLLSDEQQTPEKRWVMVAPSGGQGTALLLAKAASDRQTAAIGNQTGGRVGFFLTTDDFERDHAAWTQKGVTFTEAPRYEPYGTVAVFRDPFGNLWDLLEPKLGPLADRA